MTTRGRKAEADVQRDPHQSRSRAEGGVESPTMPDRNSTTGTTPSESFVGRVAGQDVGYEGETGAERRARAARESDQVDEEGEQSFPASDPPANY